MKTASMASGHAGRTNHAAGSAAEDQVALDYARRGVLVRHRRWRGQGGEIDLICRDGDTVVFVEVKRARSHALAAERLRPRQIARLFDAANEFLGGEPEGLRTNARFDLALVDEIGRIEILPNALM